MRAAIHFLVLGLTLFAGTRYFGAAGDAGPETSRQIVLDAGRIEGIRRAFIVGMGGIPDETEMQALLDKAVEEEVLFREALARGLETGDRAIGWRLVQKMRFLGEDAGDGNSELYERALEMGLHREDPVVRRILVQKMRLLVGHGSGKPSEADVLAYYDAHRDAYAQPARVNIRHIYFDASRRGAEQARSQAAEVAAAVATGQPAAGGDPFVMGQRLAAQSEQELSKLFGADFARQAIAAPQGAWHGPIQSAYGWHMVQVEARKDAAVPELALVRSQLERSLSAEQAQRRLEEFLATTRRAYEVKIETAGVQKGGGDA